MFDNSANRCDYQAIAASQSAAVLKGQSGQGGIGDVLAALIIVPGTTSPGVVSIQDGSNSAMTVLAGGATSVADLKPMVIAIQARSIVGAWKITTGTNVSVIAVGRFS